MANKQPLELNQLIDRVVNHINTLADIETAMQVYIRVNKHYKGENNSRMSAYTALATIYNIGRINGIREERKKRNGKRNRN